MPYALRYRLAYDSGMVTAVLEIFMRALFGFYRRLARDYGIDKVQCGAVTFVQRFGSSANLNVHFHTLALDGVYATGGDGKPVFFALRPPENHEVREFVETLSKRIGALMKRRGLAPGESDGEDSDRLVRDEPWLSAVYTASVCGRVAMGPEAGRKVAVGGDRIDPEDLDTSTTPRCAAVNGFSVHANVATGARDRSRLERLIRYAARPPLAMHRLEALPDGRLRYWFKTAWRNGTTHAIFHPLELLEKLAALVPTPRAPLVKFHGVLGPAAKWRSRIVPGDRKQELPLAAALPEKTESDVQEETPTVQPQRRGRKNYTWSELLKRVFAADVTTCPGCGGRFVLSPLSGDRKSCKTSSTTLGFRRVLRHWHQRGYRHFHSRLNSRLEG